MTGTGFASSGSVLFYFLLWLLVLTPVPRTARAESKFTVDAGASQIEVSVTTDSLKLSEAQLRQWIQDAANAVIAYYGHFPVKHVLLQIRSFEGTGVRGGQTFAALTFPSMPDQNHWIEEGIATYVEPIARIQAGQFSASRMWFELVRDMPKGQPQSGDQGLDHTHTWGRTYWGGALFCFLADIEIRKQTQNKKGLQDALRGILDLGGDMLQDWDLPRALTAGDQAVGANVLLKLYEKMRDAPMNVDLDALWKQLGVSVENGSVQFHDEAPLAVIRKSISAPRRP